MSLFSFLHPNLLSATLALNVTPAFKAVIAAACFFVSQPLQAKPPPQPPVGPGGCGASMQEESLSCSGGAPPSTPDKTAYHMYRVVFKKNPVGGWLGV